MFDKKAKSTQFFENDLDNSKPDTKGNDSKNNSFKSIEMES